jgi:hypothetical protein
MPHPLTAPQLIALMLLVLMIWSFRNGSGRGRWF